MTLMELFPFQNFFTVDEVLFFLALAMTCIFYHYYKEYEAEIKQEESLQSWLQDNSSLPDRDAS